MRVRPVRGFPKPDQYVKDERFFSPASGLRFVAYVRDPDKIESPESTIFIGLTRPAEAKRPPIEEKWRGNWKKASVGTRVEWEIAIGHGVCVNICALYLKSIKFRPNTCKKFILSVFTQWGCLTALGPRLPWGFVAVRTCTMWSELAPNQHCIVLFNWCFLVQWQPKGSVKEK